MMFHRVIVGFVLCFLMFGFARASLPVVNAASSPTIQNAVVVYHRTSIQLPSGGQLYIYGFATGGSFNSWGFKNGQYASAVNQAGHLVASLAVTSANSNSFATYTGNQAIGGVSVSGYASYTSSYKANDAWGAPEVSDTFSVQIPGSLVVVVALGGWQGCMALNGISNLQFDAPAGGFTGYANGHPAITIAHAFVNPGTYTVTELAHCTRSYNMIPDWQADLIGVFVFDP